VLTIQLIVNYQLKCNVLILIVLVAVGWGYLHQLAPGELISNILIE